jgi:hypothetical protein
VPPDQAARDDDLRTPETGAARRARSGARDVALRSASAHQHRAVVGERLPDWEKYRAFVKQLAIERAESKTDLRLSTFAAGNAGVTRRGFCKDEAFLEVEARRRPRGESVSVPLRQTGPRLSGAVSTLGQRPIPGHRRRAGRANAGRKTEQARWWLRRSLFARIFKFRSDPIVLKQIAERTGGRLLNAAATDLFTRSAAHARARSRSSTGFFSSSPVWSRSTSRCAACNSTGT